jgi:hypothetical protein
VRGEGGTTYFNQGWKLLLPLPSNFFMKFRTMETIIVHLNCYVILYFLVASFLMITSCKLVEIRNVDWIKMKRLDFGVSIVSYFKSLTRFILTKNDVRLWYWTSLTQRYISIPWCEKHQDYHNVAFYRARMVISFKIYQEMVK